MKKTLLTLLGVVLGTMFLFAQCNDFFPMKENLSFDYDLYDKKEKLSSRLRQTLKDVSGSGNHAKARMVQEIIDVKKGNVVSTTETEWVCDNGTLHFAINNMMMEGMQGNPQMTMDITGDKMDLPSKLTVGQTLDDVNYNIKMTMNGLTLMNRDFEIKERKVESKEQVTTPAGTFDCYKLSYLTVVKSGIGSGTTKSIVWYAKDGGMVKTENYKDDGKFLGRMILAKLSK